MILSPAKKMNEDTEAFEAAGLPVLIRQTEEVLGWLRSKSYEELKELWNCNDKIAKQSFERLNGMDLYKNLTPAILSYEGIAFQYMAPSVFEERQLAYIQEHLRILSAFYGVLKPLDGVRPYRLEMQAKAGILGGALRNICRLTIRTLPACLARRCRGSLSQKAHMRKWQEARWCVLWRRIRFRRKRT